MLQALQIETVDQRTSSDCVRCCVAMVLGKPYEEVPDFVLESDPWLPALEAWAFSEGYGVFRVGAAGDGELLHEPSVSGVLWIASGPTERETNHAVVYLGSEIAHDPHESRAGLLEITAATVLVRLRSPKTRRPARPPVLR